MSGMFNFHKKKSAFYINLQACHRLESIPTSFTEGHSNYKQFYSYRVGKLLHEIDWKGVKILDKESVDVKRKIKEAIHIRRQRPTLNRDGSYDLPAIFDHLLSRD